MAYDPEPVSADPSPGWLCDCGNWQEDDFHCADCGALPPWGCDCSFCDCPEDECDEDDDDLDPYEE